MEQLGKGYDPRKKTLSSQTSSSISLYLPMLFFVEPHLFSFLFAASVYFFTESRGKVILHNFWPHEHNHNVLAVTYVVNTSIIFISPTIEEAYEYLKKADNFISFKWSFVSR